MYNLTYFHPDVNLNGITPFSYIAFSVDPNNNNLAIKGSYLYKRNPESFSQLTGIVIPTTSSESTGAGASNVIIPNILNRNSSNVADQRTIVSNLPSTLNTTTTTATTTGATGPTTPNGSPIGRTLVNQTSAATAASTVIPSPIVPSSNTTGTRTVTTNNSALLNANPKVGAIINNGKPTFKVVNPDLSFS